MTLEKLMNLLEGLDERKLRIVYYFILSLK